MNSLELTYKHRRKLTSICKKLFPEIKDDLCGDGVIVFKIDNCKYCLKEYVIKGHDFEEAEETDEELFYVTTGNGGRIHWFEFIILHIVPILLKDALEIYLFYKYIAEKNAYNNPVDYIYNIVKYKKLKNE